jgi:hypothetical protein
MRATTIKKSLRAFDAKARRAVKALNPISAMQKAWKAAMKRVISPDAAKMFVRHYSKETRKNKQKKGKKQRGGDQQAGAPLDYVMGPGASAFSTVPYGQFTTDVSVDPASLKSIGTIDIPNIAQLEDCGIDRFPNNPTLAQSSGMSQSGGRRRSRRNNRKNRKNSRKNTRRQRGGNLFASLQASMTEMSRSSGYDPVPGAPHAWTNQSHGIKGLMDPSQISQLTQPNLVSQSAWGPFASSSS